MQTSYSRQMGLPGMQAEGGPADIKSYAVGEDIPFGAGFVLNALGQAVPPSAAGDAAKILGVAMRSGDIANHDGPYPFYKTGETMAGFARGRIWVMVDQPVEAGEAVHVRIKADAGKPTGVFGKTGTDMAAVPGLKFLTKSYFTTVPALSMEAGNNGSPTSSTLGYAMVEI